MNKATPRIWVLLGHRTGDNNQLLALAEGLKLPFETRTLHFNALRVLGRFLGASLLSVRDRSTLAAPWPDLVIGIGWRSVAAARWIKKASGGRTKLVRLGNPRAEARLFDLIVTTPQYPIPDAGNVLKLPLGMSRYRRAPTKTEAEQAALDGLPRPHRLVAVGGPARFWRLVPGQVCNLVARLAEREGSVIVTTSPRTPTDCVSALRSVDAANVTLFDGDGPRFPVLLADADEIYVTGDSVAMLSEAVLSGKPVAIIPIEPSGEGERALGTQASGKRDLRRFWASLRDRGLAGTVDRPIAGQTADPAETAADAVKALLGDRGE